MKARIVTERVPNPFFRCYHTTAEVSESRINSFERPLRDSSERYLEEVGKHGRAIVESLLHFDGIISVTLKPYEISVGIGEAYEWEDIEPHVITTLKRVFVEKYQVPETEIQVNDKYDAPKWPGEIDPDPDDEVFSSMIEESDTPILEEGGTQ